MLGNYITWRSAEMPIAQPDISKMLPSDSIFNGMLQYRVTRTFHIAGMKLHTDTTVLFDGRYAWVGETPRHLPELKGAIMSGWVTLVDM